MSNAVVAGIGSRQCTAEELTMVERTGAWLAKRGIALRSGGAVGADQAWARGAASVNPRLVTVLLPDSRQLARVPISASVQFPPYSKRLIELAAAEWEFGEELVHVGLPPYDEPSAQWKFMERRSWGQLVSTKPYVAQLMVRNAAILFTDPEARSPVSLVLGLLNPTSRGGGGTGHAFRLARAVGIPAFNIRNPLHLIAARALLNGGL